MESKASLGLTLSRHHRRSRWRSKRNGRYLATCRRYLWTAKSNWMISRSSPIKRLFKIQKSFARKKNKFKNNYPRATALKIRPSCKRGNNSCTRSIVTFRRIRCCCRIDWKPYLSKPSNIRSRTVNIITLTMSSIRCSMTTSVHLHYCRPIVR